MVVPFELINGKFFQAPYLLFVELLNQPSPHIGSCHNMSRIVKHQIIVNAYRRIDIGAGWIIRVQTFANGPPTVPRVNPDGALVHSLPILSGYRLVIVHADHIQTIPDVDIAGFPKHGGALVRMCPQKISDPLVEALLDVLEDVGKLADTVAERSLLPLLFCRGCIKTRFLFSASLFLLLPVFYLVGRRVNHAADGGHVPPTLDLVCDWIRGSHHALDEGVDKTALLVEHVAVCCLEENPRSVGEVDLDRRVVVDDVSDVWHEGVAFHKRRDDGREDFVVISNADSILCCDDCRFHFRFSFLKKKSKWSVCAVLGILGCAANLIVPTFVDGDVDFVD